MGGDVKPRVKIAKSGRDIIAIDGCPLACCIQSLARHDVKPKHHYLLSQFDVPKKIDKQKNPSVNEPRED